METIFANCVQSGAVINHKFLTGLVIMDIQVLSQYHVHSFLKVLFIFREGEGREKERKRNTNM